MSEENYMENKPNFKCFSRKLLDEGCLLTVIDNEITILCIQHVGFVPKIYCVSASDMDSSYV
jgi:hypothetical protein